MQRRRQRTQGAHEGVAYTFPEIVMMMQDLRPQALQIAGRWSNVDFPETLVAMAEVHFLRLHALRRFTNFTSFYLDSVRRTCRNEWLKQRSTHQRRTLAQTQAYKRDLIAQEARGEITFAERKRLEQEIDDTNAAYAFYVDDPGRDEAADLDGAITQRRADVLDDLGLGDLSDDERWLVVRDALACIWSNLTTKEKQLLLLYYVYRQSVQDMQHTCGTAVGVRLSKLKQKCRTITQDEEGKYYCPAKVAGVFTEPDFQDFVAALGYGDDDL